MDVLIDTNIWSLVLRRNQRNQQIDVIQKVVAELIQEYRIAIMGPIRQEVLSGISHHDQFLFLRERLRAFEDLSLNSIDYERAAEMFTLCRKKGIQGSHVDFLICAAAERHHLSIFTLDDDFQNYAKHLPIRLFESN